MFEHKDNQRQRQDPYQSGGVAKRVRAQIGNRKIVDYWYDF